MTDTATESRAAHKEECALQAGLLRRTHGSVVLMLTLRARALQLAAGLGFAALVATPTLTRAGDPLPFTEPVVPPGQEELLSKMLGRGAALPDGCKFAGGSADGPLITGTYTCPSGEVVYHMVYPDNASEGATQTEHFALMVESGAPPAGLADALAALVRANEGDFEWLWLTSEEEAASDHQIEDDTEALPDDSSR